MLPRSLAVIAVALLSAGWSGDHDPDRCRPQEDEHAWKQARALGKGVNFGNELDADPEEGAWTNGLKIEEWNFDLARSAGFDTVRIPVRFSSHALQEPPFTLDEAFMKRVDQVVDWGLSRGLRIVLDMHHYLELGYDPPGQGERFLALWDQIARRYRDRDHERLYFELLNEPSWAFNDDRGYAWNDLVFRAVERIRKVDRRHTIIVDTREGGIPAALDSLQLPVAERNLIVSFHYYTPSLFCFQGKDWAGSDFLTTGVVWPGPPPSPVEPSPDVTSWWALDWFWNYNNVTDPELNPAGPGVIRREIARAAEWSRRYGRPLWMGEFTAQDGADLESRARWARFVRQELESHGIGWAHWTLCSDLGSRLYDPDTHQWAEPLTDALGLHVRN